MSVQIPAYMEGGKVYEEVWGIKKKRVMRFFRTFCKKVFELYMLIKVSIQNQLYSRRPWLLGLFYAVLIHLAIKSAPGNIEFFGCLL